MPCQDSDGGLSHIMGNLIIACDAIAKNGSITNHVKALRLSDHFYPFFQYCAELVRLTFDRLPLYGFVAILFEIKGLGMLPCLRCLVAGLA